MNLKLRNLIKEALDEIDNEEIFYHSSKNDLSINKIIKAKKNDGTFGDYELLIEKYRPKNEVSRLECFFLSKNKYEAGSYGGSDAYKVMPIGKVSKCAFGWVNILMKIIPDIGYKKGYGYKIDFNKITKEQQDVIKNIVTKYYSGIKPTKKDFENVSIKVVSIEDKLIEYLAEKIKVIK